MQVFIIDCAWKNDRQNIANTTTDFHSMKKIDSKSISKLLDCEHAEAHEVTIGDHIFTVFCDPQAPIKGKPNSVVISDDGTLFFGKVILVQSQNEKFVDMDEDHTQCLKNVFGIA